MYHCRWYVWQQAVRPPQRVVMTTDQAEIGVAGREIAPGDGEVGGTAQAYPLYVWLVAPSGRANWLTYTLVRAGLGASPCSRPHRRQ
jgi:hypothetical protein